MRDEAGGASTTVRSCATSENKGKPHVVARGGGDCVVPDIDRQDARPYTMTGCEEPGGGLLVQHCGCDGGRYVNWHGGFLRSERQGRAEDFRCASAVSACAAAAFQRVFADREAVGAERGQHQYRIDHKDSAATAW